jgi:hypothetical protein
MKDAALAAVGYAAAIRFLVMVVVGGAIVLGFAQALGFFWRILTDGQSPGTFVHALARRRSRRC